MTDQPADHGNTQPADQRNDGAARPVLRVVRGNPTVEDLAIVAAIVSTAPSGDIPAGPQPARRGRWNDPAYTLRRPLHPGVGGWRASVQLP